MASTSISKQTSGTPTNNKKFTFSFWVKRNRLGTNQNVYIHERGSGYGHTHKIEFGFHSSDSFFFGTWDGSSEYYSRTKRRFRDINSWMHVVIAVDSTDGTNTNRLKWYFNGEQYSIDGAMFDAGPSYPAQDWVFNSNTWSHHIGRYVSSGGASNYLDACLTDFCFVDGQALTPSSFGETDTDTGEWRVKDFAAGDITWGTNGYRILKDGISLTDVSSNSHNFNADTGTLTKTLDNPNNVFATWNVLDSHYFWGAEESSWCTNGNTTARSGNSQYSSCTATLGASKGKYYWEFKYVAKSGSQNLWHLGIKSTQDTTSTNALGEGATDYSYKAYNGQQMNNGSSSAYGSTYAVGDIIGIAMDLDNNKLYFSKNGVFQNSGDPTSGSTGTGAISITDPASTVMGVYLPAWSWNDGSSYGTIEANFGNGYFGTQAITSNSGNGYQDADGNGKMNYSVPTGYRCLCTKGLNQ